MVASAADHDQNREITSADAEMMIPTFAAEKCRAFSRKTIDPGRKTGGLKIIYLDIDDQKLYA